MLVEFISLVIVCLKEVLGSIGIAYGKMPIRCSMVCPNQLTLLI